ncbi:hypothetical protein [Acinetobacter schindleri]|uniref:hypothetical protein n=1 Tax=Acinetobacter schindleri TaxID=108981 RepID=UPI0022F3F871|nr:hypothetical protein [Acinetobacter schindleri]WBX38995.1 hypothetical protein MYA84_04955 [Acinetobacter schindleri]
MSSPTPNNSYKELLGILGAITLIFLLWISYPRFMQYMDDAPEQKSVQMVIPYTLDAMLTTEPTSSESVAEEKTKFQKIGDQYGTYGDSYGSLNTLFSGLAFAILIISLFMQRQELQAQRQELEEQRKEIKESNEIAEQQRLITEQQKLLNEQQIHDGKVENFYNLLFRFLDEKRRKIEDFELSRKSEVKGHYIFDYFLQGALEHLKVCYGNPNEIEHSPDEELTILFEDFIREGNELSRRSLSENEYFEYICFILRFIKKNENLGILSNAIKIFISYQSITEMSCMFFISLEDEELQDYIKEYALLRKMNNYEVDTHFQALVDRTIGEEAYTPTAQI